MLYRYHWVERADRVVEKASRYVSYISTACLLFVCVLAFVNVVTNKLFTYTIPNQHELIEYLLIPIVYFSVANIQLTRGLTNVDFIVKHLPNWVNQVVKFISFLVGAFVYSFAAYRGWFLLLKYIKNHEMSSVSASAFPLWPFVLMYIIGTVFLVLAFLWSLVRLISSKSPENNSGNKEPEVTPDD